MGAQHDMRLAKKHLAELYPYKIVIADKGYQGLAKPGLQTPKKKSKHHPLNKQDKEAVRQTQNRHRAHQQEAEDIQNLVAALPQQAETVRVKGKSDCRTG